jgi:ribosomal protein L21E
MVCSKDSEIINIKIDENFLKQVPKFKYIGSIFTVDGKNKEDIIQLIKEAKVMFNNKKQLVYLEERGKIKKTLYN